MIIECPSCFSKFEVQDEAIGSSGRFVRCSVCSHEWVEVSRLNMEKNTPSKEKETSHNNDQFFENKVEEDNIATALKIKNKSIFKQTHKDFLCFFIPKIGALASVVCFVLLIALSCRERIVAVIPESQVFYDYISLYENNGLKLSAINWKASKLSADYNKDIIGVEVEVTIENISKRSQKLNLIRFTIYDQDKNQLNSLEVSVDKFIDAEQQHIVNAKLNAISNSAAYVMVELGNAIDVHVHNIDYIKKYN